MRFANSIGGYEIDSLPSQVQVAICHGFFVDPNMRGQGHGHKLKGLQECDLRELAYDYALCTVSAKNVEQHRVLDAAGWQKLAQFNNRRLGESTQIWGKAVEAL